MLRRSTLRSGYLGLATCLAGTMPQSVLAQPAPQPSGPLRNLPVCSTARLMPPNASNPAEHCVADRTGKKVELDLVAQPGVVDVGGYKVDTDHYNERYDPPVLEVRAGDTLAISLTNRLAPAQPTFDMVHGEEDDHMPPMVMPMPTGQTNLHTHGLVVSPRNATGIAVKPSQNGDNAYAVLDHDCTAAAAGCRTAARYSIHIPKTLPDHVAGDRGGRVYPSGLSWYHPHIHGLASEQVSGGMAGLISVGDPRNAIAGFGAGNSAIQVRYLALQDIQLKTTTAPEAAAGSPATWSKPFDPGFCGDRTDTTVARPGYCAAAGNDGHWLFTVNGQRFPQIDVDAGKGHLWRIANLSATVSYVLQLRNDAGNLVPMKIVAVDGVTAGRAQPHPVANSSRLQILERQSILVMPASRIEVLMPNFAAHAQDKFYTLATRGFRAADHLAPDLWFPVDLARIRLRAGSRSRTAPSELFAPTVIADQPVSASILPPTEARRLADVQPGTLCAHRLGPNERRLVRLIGDPDNGAIEALELGSGIANSTDGDASVNADRGNVIPAVARTMPMGAAALDDNLHGCAVLRDPPEVWEIRNDTDEIHNFHVHQAKFRLAADPEIAAVASATYLERHPRNGGGIDPAGAVDTALFTDNAAELAVWHDTIPVLPHRSTFIRIAFTSPLQLGRFMIHCHILEHEDKGMMAGFEVLRAN